VKAALATLLALAALPAAARTLPEPWVQTHLRELCGQAYEGRVVANQPPPATPDPFESARLVIQVQCTGGGFRIPLAVGEDRSRTWVLTTVDGRLQLKHDHRHADGTPDAVTNYGGRALDEGTATRVAFPADEESKALFLREGLPASVDNTWALELHPGRILAYELTRPGGRRFRIEFDLAQPVPLD